MTAKGVVYGKSVLIVGITSGIGEKLAKFYLRDGARIVGTYRSLNEGGRGIVDLTSYRVDVTDPESLDLFRAAIASEGFTWDLLIISIGTLEPIGSFFALDFKQWKQSFDANLFGQLYLVHELWDFRNRGASIVFFTGGAPNGVLPNFSAYGVAKIALTKMVEYLDAEDREINYVIIGPGWVNTKIHEQTIRAGSAAGSNLGQTRAFLDRGEAGTPITEIYDCINWLSNKGKALVGGRNFSIVWDKWGSREGSATLENRLAADRDLYKLRRYEGSEDK